MKPTLSHHGFKTRKGKYVPINVRKYIGNPDQIYYRSGLERRVCEWCDITPAVEMWGSEEVSVPYISMLDGKQHRYFIDFVIKMRNKEGKPLMFLVEVKPEKQCHLPSVQADAPQVSIKSQRRRMAATLEYGRNVSKWNAAIKYANTSGMVFEIWSEPTLRRLGIL